MNNLSTPLSKAYSWTLDINIAKFFADRLETGTGKIIKGIINLNDVIAYKDNSEKEIICMSDKVKIVELI